LASERPRNVGWLQAAGLLFGDWGTSRLYVLGLAFFFAGRSSFWLILLMSVLILAVGARAVDQSRSTGGINQKRLAGERIAPRVKEIIPEILTAPGKRGHGIDAPGNAECTIGVTGGIILITMVAGVSNAADINYPLSAFAGYVAVGAVIMLVSSISPALKTSRLNIIDEIKFE
jgi:hypothetical protein